MKPNLINLNKTIDQVAKEKGLNNKEHQLLRKVILGYYIKKDIQKKFNKLIKRYTQGK